MTVTQVIERRAVEAAPPALSSLFRYAPPVSRETVAEWQRELDRYFPPADRLSRLVIRWEAGDEWQPIQRFVIWQCQDPRYTEIPPFIRDELAGPHPRTKGHYCATGFSPVTGKLWCRCPIKANRWKGGASRFTDRATWALYHETGLYGRRWWTIQGHKGGHRFQWDPNEYEAKLSQMKGGPTQTPAPGDLEYAPFDARVLERIAHMDKVRAWTMMADFATRHPDQLDAEEAEEADAVRSALWHHIDWGIEEAWDEGGSAFSKYLEQTYGRAPAGDEDDLDYEAVQQAFHQQF